jgi:predicted membrane-bound spermidine synthase
MGMMPLGSLLAGVLASRLGAPRTIALGGAICLAAALVFASQLSRLRAHVRPIYVRLGIIPEVAAGVQAASDLTTPPERQ